ncbi:hypothetical protein C8F04DRAFT_1193744 [Mycena alexandri]|uniref:Uncharacterized protein n=1 Tax=Mycena alexandri TaxID=1745969 RepID=A0AAD6S8G8_9AGAR|nr:hypothetical protein C8F04DRAFT_1193744 [Mycena alexandri]
MPEMFKPYDEAAVPNAMPFPPLLRVATTKTEETAVPKLNEYQRSWIFAIALRGKDLATMQPSAVKDLYETVKTDAFAAKAFQHTVQPGDAAEEASLPLLVARWKRGKNTKGKTPAADAGDASDVEKSAADGGDGSDDEEDEGARVGLLRGYTKAGWRLAIQKVLTNKRSADKNKKRDNVKAENADVAVPALALAKVFGLATHNGRDKFRQERRDEIRELSKKLPGTFNAGGKSRRAEAELWVDKDREEWEAAAAANEGVNWVERQQYVTGAVQHMVETLNSGGKFRPFLATMLMGWLDERHELQLEWVEALPNGLQVHQRLEEQYPQLTTNYINAMHAWAKQPLQDYAAARNGPAEPAAPVFTLTPEVLDDMSPNAVAQAVTQFLGKSYQAAFGDEVIPWAAIADKPEQYYDTDKFDIVFTARGMEGFKGAQWYALGGALAAGAGEGSSGLFRKVSVAGSGEQERENSEDNMDEVEEEEVARRKQQEEEEEARRQQEPEEEARRQQEEEEEARRQQEEEEEARRRQLEAEEEEEEEARRQQEEEEEARRRQLEAEEEEEAEARRKQLEAEEEEAEARRKQQEEEEEARRQQEAEEEARRQQEEEEEARRQQEEEEEARRQQEEEEARRQQEQEEEVVAKKGKGKAKKRKAAEAELEPEQEGGRPARVRKTPAEAEAERNEKMAAEVKRKSKPGFEYVRRSPVKGGGARRGRNRSGLKTSSGSGVAQQYYIDQLESPSHASRSCYWHVLRGELKTFGCKNQFDMARHSTSRPYPRRHRLPMRFRLALLTPGDFDAPTLMSSSCAGACTIVGRNDERGLTVRLSPASAE